MLDFIKITLNPDPYRYSVDKLNIVQRNFEMNANKAVTEEHLIRWIKQSLEEEEFGQYEIEFTGKSEKGEGYLGEIVYVNISGIIGSGGKKVLDLVIKYSKNHSYLRKVSPVKSAFRREIFIYDIVFPAFQRIHLRKNIKNGFTSVPKCYKTIILDDMEILVLENLKKWGYVLHDGKKPLNVPHLRVILVEYAKLHALSFALRDQSKEEFDDLTKCDYDFFQKFFSEISVKRTFQRIIDDAIQILEERNDNDLCLLFRKLLVKDAGNMLSDLTEEIEPQSAVIHGDCWNNNFMFQYQNEDKTSPSKVAILDWQISGMRSPAIDLSFLIYANCSKEGLDKFEELMETYYTAFSEFLRELGSDPDQLFSYTDLKRHWRKYSLFALLFVPMVWRLVLSTKDEVPVFEELKEGEEFGSIMVRDAIGDKDTYYSRLKPVVSHYFGCTF